MANMIVNPLSTQTATIFSSASLSDDMGLGGLRLFGVVMPSSWTTANLTFQMSADNGITWNNVYDKDGNEVTAVAAAGNFIAVDPMTFSAIRLLRVRSGTSGSAVAQMATRSLTLVLRAV